VDTRGNQRIRRMPVAEQTKITALDNGPYLVKGPVVVVDAEGNRFPAERETIALCRCGGSTTKPFCDGTHSKVGFRAAEGAVREEEGQER
jgi:CDGSH-type Zn-finger protein